MASPAQKSFLRVASTMQFLAQEAKNTLNAPLEEKFYRGVRKCVRKKSDTVYNNRMNFFV